MTTTFQSSGSTTTVDVPNGTVYVLRDYNDIYTANGDGLHLMTGVLATTVLNYGFIWADDNGVEVISDNARISNFGTLTSFTGDAFNLGGGEGMVEIYNYGRVMANDGEVIDIDTVGDKDIVLFNAGTMVARGADIVLDGAIGNIEITNSGILDGNELGMSGSGTSRLINTGQILTTGIDMRSEGAALLINQGTLINRDGSGALIMTSLTAADTVLNGGGILGRIELGDGDDIFENTGTGFVSGRVLGEAGLDTLVGGEGADQMEGGGGSDVLIGRGGDDVLTGLGSDVVYGGTANDTINGGGGDDTLDGGTQNDVLVGQDGSDLLYGDEGADTLDGGDGNDVLEGGADNDVLRGRAGEDELAGGLGLDFLTGGADADAFVFRTTAHAGIGATRDQILDFEQGLDLINVVSMSAGVFSFIGTDPFTAINQIRVIETATGSSIVQFNTDADLTAEAELRVGGVTGLTMDDFAL
jgi:serralysin